MSIHLCMPSEDFLEAARIVERIQINKGLGSPFEFMQRKRLMYRHANPHAFLPPFGLDMVEPKFDFKYSSIDVMIDGHLEDLPEGYVTSEGIDPTLSVDTIRNLFRVNNFELKDSGIRLPHLTQYVDFALQDRLVKSSF